MEQRMTKVECDVLMHLLHRQCVFRSQRVQLLCATMANRVQCCRYSVDAAYGQVSSFQLRA